jgi:DNA-binding NarL/FixJ family response regulator
MRVIVAEDMLLTREGIVRLLADAGMDVVAQADDLDGLLRAVARYDPDAVVVDIRMPPTRTDEGLVAAERIRARHPSTVVLVLSQYLETAYAMRLLEEHPAGVGYLLKDRILDAGALIDGLRRLSDGQCVVDPTIVSRLLGRQRRDDPLGRLTERETEVLALVAEGMSNAAIARRLVITERTVEAHTASIFAKLGLVVAADTHRRVLAVLTYLRS